MMMRKVIEKEKKKEKIGLKKVTSTEQMKEIWKSRKKGR